MTDQQKPREWFIILEDESGDDSCEGFAYADPCANSNQREIHVIEKAAYDKAVATLKKIANEDLRGNRPQCAVDAYNCLKELGEI